MNVLFGTFDIIFSLILTFDIIYSSYFFWAFLSLYYDLHKPHLLDTLLWIFYYLLTKINVFFYLNLKRIC